MSHRIIRAALATLMLMLALALPGLALAHGGHTGPAQTFTQDIGPYEIAITIEIPSGAPAPLYLNIAPQEDVGGVTMQFRAVPRGQPFAGAAIAEVQGLPGTQGIYYTELAIDRMGDWELEARASGPRGSGVARIPFTITANPMPAGSIGLFVALGGLVVAMIASIITSLVGQRRTKPLPGWLRWGIGQAMFACLIAAAIFGAQQFSSIIQNAQAASGTIPTVVGRPHANLAIHTNPGTAQASQPMTLTLNLSDGSTGLPIDDLITHHDALVHLVVISADGGFYAHMHPPRSAPGQFDAALTPDRPGRYTAYVEIERLDSGIQVIARDFMVGGTTSVAPPTFQGMGERTVNGLQVHLTANNAQFKAGKQATFTFSFSQHGKPLDDLQPWLGMGGHLIARSDDGAIFGHIHALGPMAPAGLMATGTNYGPNLQFVYTFPQAGHYLLWGQFRRAEQIITVPFAVDVQ